MSLAVYGLPLVVTTSGGKESSVCVALAERAGIPFEVLHNHTTADAPETVYFIREEFRRLEAVSGGTVEELRAIQCVETCRGYEVERLELTVDDVVEDWTKPDKPVLVITVGEKEAEA